MCRVRRMRFLAGAGTFGTDGRCNIRRLHASCAGRRNPLQIPVVPSGYAVVTTVTHPGDVVESLKGRCAQRNAAAFDWKG